MPNDKVVVQIREGCKAENGASIAARDMPSAKAWSLSSQDYVHPCEQSKAHLCAKFHKWVEEQQCVDFDNTIISALSLIKRASIPGYKVMLY